MMERSRNGSCSACTHFSSACIHLQLSMCALLVKHVYTFIRSCAHFQLRMCTLLSTIWSSLEKWKFLFLAKSFTCEKSVKLCQVTEYSRNGSCGWCMHTEEHAYNHRKHVYFSLAYVHLQLSMCTSPVEHAHNISYTCMCILLAEHVHTSVCHTFSWAYAHF